jgi:chemotaxis methyl-accepting protein methylase
MAGGSDQQRRADIVVNARISSELVSTVLDIVRARTGVDFSCYRASMLERRIANHISSSAAVSIDDYLRLLRSSVSQSYRLLERITIKVSRFYRHAPAFDHLRDEVLPALARARGGEPLRIWSVGCGAGEEPYTFAMLLEQARIPGTIVASDIDASSLCAAREGIYSLEAAAELPPALLMEYLEPIVVKGQPRYRVQDSLRARVRFTRHDITSAAPAPRGHPFDLVSCRNVLIYFQRTAQADATKRLLDMIGPGGVLCLGEAEWPLPELEEFLEPLPRPTRLFRLPSPQPFVEDHELNRARFRTGV